MNAPVGAHRTVGADRGDLSLGVFHQLMISCMVMGGVFGVPGSTSAHEGLVGTLAQFTPNAGMLQASPCSSGPSLPIEGPEPDHG